MKNISQPSNISDALIDAQKTKRIAELSQGLENKSITIETIKKELPELLKNITTLHLSQIKITDEFCTLLAFALSENTSITTFNLSSVSIGIDALKTLFGSLKSNPNLKHLVLLDIDIGDLGSDALAKFLDKNQTLETLKLWNNKIGDKGAELIALALIGNRTLKIFDLKGNKIREVKLLAKSLASIDTLKTIDLANNTIDNIGAEAFLNALESNTSLIFLGLNGQGQINSATIESINILLKKNQAVSKPELTTSVAPEAVVLASSSTQRRKSSIFRSQLRSEMLEGLEALKSELATELALAKEEARRVATENQALRQEVASLKASQQKLESLEQLEKKLEILTQRVESNPTIDPAVNPKQFEEVQNQVAGIQVMARRLSAIDKQTGLNAQHLEVMGKQISSIKGEISELQTAGEIEEITDSKTINEVIAVVQKSRSLLESDAGEISAMVQERRDGKAAKNQLAQAISTDKAQEYYLDIIRMLGGLHAASLTVGSGWVASKKTGVLGAIGSIAKIAGLATPGGGVLSAFGDLMKLLGSEVQARQIAEFSQMCPSPVDMDNIAKALALALVQEGQDQLEGKNIGFQKYSQAVLDVEAITKFVFKGNFTKAQNPSAIAAQLFKAITGKDKQFNIASETNKPATATIHPNDFEETYARVKNQQTRTLPRGTDPKEIALVREAGVKLAKIIPVIFIGIQASEEDKAILPLSLEEIVEEQVISNPDFGQFFTKSRTNEDPNVVSIEDMGKLLQAALRSRGVINSDNQVDSSKIRDRSVMESVVKEFAGKLLERKVGKGPVDASRVSVSQLQTKERQTSNFKDGL